MNDMMLRIYLSFIKIGMFSFGGGLTVISLIKNDVVNLNGWLSPEQFLDIMAIAEITPGPLAVNTSTFTGYLMGGIIGGILCTFCVILVPVLLTLLSAFFFEKLKDNRKVKAAVKGIRPAAVGIIAAAGYSIFSSAFPDYISAGMFGLAALIVLFLKKSPVVAILACGFLGVIVYGFIL